MNELDVFAFLQVFYNMYSATPNNQTKSKIANWNRILGHWIFFMGLIFCHPLIYGPKVNMMKLKCFWWRLVGLFCTAEYVSLK